MDIKKNKGLTLIELTVVMAVIGFLAVVALSQSKYETDMLKARALGLELYEVHNAARRYAAINSANPDLRASGNVIIQNGLNWLKSQDNCNGGEAVGNFISCDQQDATTFGGLTYTTEINPTLDPNTVIIKTVIDTKNYSGTQSTILPEEVLGVASMIARGGASASSISVGGINSSITDPSVSNTSSLIVFCSAEINENLLNENCSNVNSTTPEGGLIVMLTQSSSTTSAWLLTNGSNAMRNDLTFSSTNPNFREIKGVDRIYNLTGEILKLGNSGIYYDDGSFLPILGSGLVIDTDLYAVGNLKNMGDIEVDGDLLTEGSAFVDGAVYARGQIITESDMEVWGNQYVLGQTFINGDANVFGTISADRVRASTFIEAREISATGGIYAGQLVNAPVIRASVNLVSEGDLTVAGDTIIGGNEYIEGNSITQGTLYSGGDLIADSGASYLGNVFASVIYDNEGNYMLDPSGISRLNVMRADKLAPSTSGGTLSLNSNNFLFTSESDSCDVASDSCATALEGYWDIESLYVKNVANGNWERLVDWMSRIQTKADENQDKIDNPSTPPSTGYEGWIDPEADCMSGEYKGVGGVWKYGIFYPREVCP